jgi:SAM-dependent methyltransferase
MMKETPLPSVTACSTDDVRSIWETNATFWDDYMGDLGNNFQRELVGVQTVRLMEIQLGETILDIACGNGIFARRMAELGANVVAFDFCRTFLSRATDRSERFSDRIQYLDLDATDYDSLLSLGRSRFDGAVCTMALMDIAEIEPLARALSELLKPGARFVFSVCHPSFNSAQPILVAERGDTDTGLSTEYAVKIGRYVNPFTYRGVGIPGQPELHPYFHRPLNLLLKPFFAAGFVLDALEEPAFGPNSSDSNVLSWSNFNEIPPALVARLRFRN